jgi:hypothetical protein
MEHMEVPVNQREDREKLEQRPTVLPFPASTGRHLSREDTANLTAEWRDRELRSIGGWVQCRGLSPEQLEDIYQETVVELLDRRHRDQEHLRYALRSGIRMRAMNMRRDGRRHEEILAASEPELRLLTDARQAREQPEQIVLKDQDRLIAWEFMTELSDIEKRTYQLMVDGMGADRIARTRGIPVNDARRLIEACERKREVFQVLYERGRLCGYRASTIEALLRGESSTQELADRAFAHLDSCPRCRAEHKTNANRLRRSFRDQVAALLPVPVIATHLDWTEKLGLRARIIQHRLSVGDLPFSSPGARERATMLFAGGGLTGKLAAGTATLALLAGGAIDAARTLEHHATRSHQKTPPVASTIESEPNPQLQQAVFAFSHPTHSSHHAPTPGRGLPMMPGHVVPIRPAKRTLSPGRQHEPDSLAYLGIPANRPASSVSRTHSPEQRGGGPFSP